MSGKPDDIECANEIDLDDLLEIIQREGPVLTHGLDRVANSRTVDDDPQLAIAVGELNGLGNGILVSDVAAANSTVPPTASSASLLADGRSRAITRAPDLTSAVTVASPRPDAPPVTSADVPDISILGSSYGSRRMERTLTDSTDSD